MPPAKPRPVLKLGLGKCFVEVMPGKDAAAVQLRGPARFSFIPDFFGSDVLYDAQQTAGAKVFAPAENFIVNLVEGHAALSMITWPKDGGEEVLLLCEGTGANRRFTATQVSFNGKSVFVAVVAREGTWFEKDLRTAKKDATLVVEGWQPPFPAKWMTLLAKRPAVGATSGITFRDAAGRRSCRRAATRRTATSSSTPTCPVGSRAPSGGSTWNRASRT